MSLELPWTRSALSSEGVMVDEGTACDVAESPLELDLMFQVLGCQWRLASILIERKVLFE